MKYNTGREEINMREYGRHVQQVVEYIVSIEKKEERQCAAENVINLMSILNPQLKNIADYKHKLWDHIFIISDFKLDVDSPYPKPTEDTYRIQPAKLPYPQQRIKLKHYGKNVESLVKKAIDMEDENKREFFTEIIGNFMKMAYKNWSNEEVSNDLIKEDMKSISGGELEISAEMNIETMTRNQPKRRFGSNNINNKNRNNNNKNRKNLDKVDAANNK